MRSAGIATSNRLEVKISDEIKFRIGKILSDDNTHHTHHVCMTKLVKKIKVTILTICCYYRYTLSQKMSLLRLAITLTYVNRLILFLAEMLLNLDTTNYGPVAANISEERLPSLVRNQGKTAVYISTHSASAFYIS